MEEIQSTKIERNTRVLVSKLLRVGVLTAASITFIGGILFFIQHPETIFAYDTFNGEPARLRQATIIIREALAFKSRAVIQFGILVLIATPVLRVFFSLVGFTIEKDWTFVVITGIVVIVLMYSLLG
jgi:uncharacterized membrane protein